MFLAVAVPMLFQAMLPERPSAMVRSVFETIENLPEGSRIFMAFDYDPASKGELHPMAAAFTRHCAERRHKLYFMTLWPQGVPMVEQNINIIRREYPDYVYGRDYVNLGFQVGSEAVIKLLVSNFQKQFNADAYGASVAKIPMTKDIRKLQQMNLVVSVTAGTPGTKEWVQYAAAPYGIAAVSGATGVSAPGYYPYVPQPLKGILGAIKGAAEYEEILAVEYPSIAANSKAKQALRRMVGQMVGHVLVIGLVILGNVVYFMERQQGAAR
jgi:hypothetical protein